MTDPSRQPDLRNRLRELRKSHGWTLVQVADQLGTTAQTVSRLETNVMTVSTDWLQKFAVLFGVSAADLIADRGDEAIPVIGTVAADGRIAESASGPLPIPVALTDAIAVRIGANIGPYSEGSFVVATKLSGRNVATAKGRICICQSAHGTLWLARLIEGMGDNFTLVPLERGEVQYDVALDWVARVQLDLRLTD